MLKNVSIIIPLAPHETSHELLLDDLKHTSAEIILSCEGTRAHSLNRGADKAHNTFLWFLHADSRVSAENIEMLGHALESHPKTLHYFDLAFDGLSLNAWGANMRSRLFGTPFGDQGFCIAKPQFSPYPEDVPYGEDLLFVWHMRQAGIKLNNIPSKLLTSARKYREQGWLKLTFLYQWRWIKLSLPQAWVLMKGKR